MVTGTLYQQAACDSHGDRLRAGDNLNQHGARGGHQQSIHWSGIDASFLLIRRQLLVLLT
jgi:hypothetical protein